MKRYIFGRVIRSIISLVLAITLIYTIIFTMVPRRNVFKNDPLYTKMTSTPDKKADYENRVFKNLGYIEYKTSKDLVTGAATVDSSVTTDANSKNEEIYKTYLKNSGSGWVLKQYPESKQYYATREIPIYERVFKFYGNLIQVDHPWKIQDSSNKDLERYIKIENDELVGWSIVGSGTKHKYLLYFNGNFPYIHQNFVTLDLGDSFPDYQGKTVMQVLTQGQGKAVQQKITFPTGKTVKTSIDIYSRTYKSPSEADEKDIEKFGKGDSYTKTETVYSDPSMIASSSIIGLVGIIIAYVVGIPLGVAMSRYKNRLFDNVSTVVLSFMLALPSIAFVYIFRFVVGTLFGLPDKFTVYGAQDIRSYILPALILGFLSVPGIAIWIRRYMIDLQSSDFVRFARSKGMTEAEISRKHILKNAMVPVVVGIPGAILGVIAGATFTESVFAFPGMGKLLIDAIGHNNNSLVIGLSFIFAAIGIFSVMLGDILMTIIDPRIKLTNQQGGK